MPRREDFDNSLWSDPDFLALTPEAKLTYIWTWTNPRCGMAGLYKLALSQTAAETGLTEQQIRDAMRELGEARFAFYEGQVLWVRTRVKHLRQKTKQIAKSVANDLARVRDSHPLKARFLASYGEQVWLKEAVSGEGHETVESPSADPLEPLDGHLTVLGTGTGTGSGTGSKEMTRASELVAQVTAIFKTEPRIYINQAGIENAIAAWPNRDYLNAAHVVASWVSDPAFNTTNGARLLSTALSKQTPAPAGAAAPVTDFSKYDIAAANKRRDREAA